MGVLVRHTVPDFLFLEGTIIGLLELFLIAVGLSMDAFAVSVCKGLSTQTLQRRHYLIVGAWFGGFQALMPTLGYLLGSTFEQYITSVDHWVAFILLSVIGGNMIWKPSGPPMSTSSVRRSFASTPSSGPPCS